MRTGLLWGWVVVIALGPGCLDRTLPVSPDDEASSTASPGGDETDDAGQESRCAASPESLADCIEPDRYSDDLRFIAEIRVPGDTHWLAVQELCFDRLTSLGYQVELQDYGTGINVIGRKPGTTRADETVVLGAHYDHIPGCKGADDNATGVAGILELARVMAEAQFERSLAIGCWDQEEIGLIGSRSFVLAAEETGEELVANFNLEMIGFASDEPNSQSVPFGFDGLFPTAYQEVEANGFRGDFVAFVGDEDAAAAGEALTRYADRISLPNVWLQVPRDLKKSEVIGDLRRSDHAPFWDADIPAIMITDTSNFRYEYYHCGAGEDSVDRLDDAFASSILRATAGSMSETLMLVQ